MRKSALVQLAIAVLAGLAAVVAVLTTLAAWRAAPRARAAAGVISSSDGGLGRLLAPFFDRGGFPPLALAARQGDLPRLDALLAAGADPNLHDWAAPNGWTPLLHAVHKGQDVAVARLLAAGADVNARARGGTTALMIAAGQGEASIVRLLLASGAWTRAAGPLGATALANAVANGHEEVVRELLAADPGLRLGHSPMALASRGLAWLRGDSRVLALVDRSGRSGAGLRREGRSS